MNSLWLFAIAFRRTGRTFETWNEIVRQTAWAAAVLRRNLLVSGAGGVLLPVVGIKAIDVVLVLVDLA